MHGVHIFLFHNFIHSKEVLKKLSYCRLHCELARYSVTQKYATATTRTAICDLNQRVS